MQGKLEQIQREAQGRAAMQIPQHCGREHGWYVKAARRAVWLEHSEQMEKAEVVRGVWECGQMKEGRWARVEMVL